MMRPWQGKTGKIRGIGAVALALLLTLAACGRDNSAGSRPDFAELPQENVLVAAYGPARIDAAAAGFSLQAQSDAEIGFLIGLGAAATWPRLCENAEAVQAFRCDLGG